MSRQPIGIHAATHAPDGSDPLTGYGYIAFNVHNALPPLSYLDILTEGERVSGDLGIRLADNTDGGGGGIEIVTRGESCPIRIAADGDVGDIEIVNNGAGAVLVENSGDGGIEIQSDGDGHILIKQTGDAVIRVENSGDDGIEIVTTDAGITMEFDTNLILNALPPADPSVANAVWADNGVLVLSGSVAGGTPGAARVLGPFPFAFDDAGLNTGVAFYTPTVDDVLLDAWIEIDEAWDGTTPTGDIGTFVASTSGLWASVLPVDMTKADFEPGTGTLNGSGGSAASLASTTYASATRLAPLRFTVANPLKVIVTTTGATSGSDPGATQGSGKVYLVIANPALS